jgi:hypothetical protein
LPFFSIEQDSGDCSTLPDAAPQSYAAVEVITHTPKNQSVRPVPSCEARTAEPGSAESAIEISPIESSTKACRPVAEEPGGEIVEQEAPPHVHPGAPQPGNPSRDKSVGGGTADQALESYQPCEETPESEAKAELKLLLRMATSFGSHMEESTNLPAESGWGGLDGVGDAMCFGLTSPLQGNAPKRASH